MNHARLTEHSLSPHVGLTGGIRKGNKEGEQEGISGYVSKQNATYPTRDTATDCLLEVQRISLKTANDFVVAHHRHSKPDRGHLFSIGLFAGVLDLRGVAIVGRPKAAALDDGATVEVTRLATDGTRNACSMLYGAACRLAKRQGYAKAVTYTLATETGASLRAAGFQREAAVRGQQWDRPKRRRALRETPDRVRWGRSL